MNPFTVELALLVVDEFVWLYRQAIDLGNLQIFRHFGAKIKRICIVVQVMVL